MKKSRNKSGFTLIELIVVMAVFGIIFAAILNLLNPLNSAYNNAETVKNTNQVGTQLIDYVDSQVRYATNVLVLKDYNGVPAVSDSGKIGSILVNYTDCLIFDNSNVRGSSTNNYDASANASRRKGCTGTIIHISGLNSGNYSLANSEIGMGEDFYGSESYEFDIDLVTQNKKQNLDITVTGFQGKYEDGSYKFEKTRYENSRAFDLANVNIDFTDDYDAKIYDFSDASVADYTTFARATAPDGLTSGQSEYYKSEADSSTTYTYIFYNKRTTSDTIQGKITFKYKTSHDASTEYTVVRNVDYGKSIEFSQIPSVSDPPYEVKFQCVEEPSRIYATEEDWKSFIVDGDYTFEIQFTLDKPMVTPNFTDINGTLDTTSYWLSGANFYVGAGISHSSPGDPKGFDAEKMVLDYWYTYVGGTEVKLSDYEFSEYGIQPTFYPHVTYKHKVIFKLDASDSDDDAVATSYVLGDKPVAPSDPTPPTDYKFDGWFMLNDDGSVSSTKVTDDYEITADTVFVAVFSEKGTGLTIVDENPIPTSTGWCLEYQLDILNETDEDIDHWVVKIQFPECVTGVGYYDWRFSNYDGCSVFDSATHTLTITSNDNNNVKISAGGSFELKLSQVLVTGIDLYGSVDVYNIINVDVSY